MGAQHQGVQNHSMARLFSLVWEQKPGVTVGHTDHPQTCVVTWGCAVPMHEALAGHRLQWGIA